MGHPRKQRTTMEAELNLGSSHPPSLSDVPFLSLLFPALFHVFFLFPPLSLCLCVSLLVSFSLLCLSTPFSLPKPSQYVTHKPHKESQHQKVFGGEKHPSPREENPGEETRALKKVPKVISPCQIPTSLGLQTDRQRHFSPVPKA